MKGIKKSEEGAVAFPLLIVFILFFAIPLFTLMLYSFQFFQSFKWFYEQTDSAILSATTQVQRVNYTYNGDSLWYYVVNQTGGIMQSNGDILLNSSSSPVWSLAYDAINQSLSRQNMHISLTSMSILLMQNPFTQVITDQNTSSTWSVAHTDYITGKITATFTIPSTFINGVITDMFQGTLNNPNQLTETAIHSASIAEPSLSVFN